MYFFFRPFERTLTLHKDSTGHVGFQFSSGKITAIVVDSSAARNGLLIEHNLLEVGAIILILQCSYSYMTSHTMGKKFIKNKTERVRLFSVLDHVRYFPQSSH